MAIYWQIAITKCTFFSGDAIHTHSGMFTLRTMRLLVLSSMNFYTHRLFDSPPRLWFLDYPVVVGLLETVQSQNHLVRTRSPSPDWVS